MNDNMHEELNAKAPFEILCEQRNAIADLYERLGNWLSKFNRFNQVAEDYYRRQQELISAADVLINEGGQEFEPTKNAIRENDSISKIESENKTDVESSENKNKADMENQTTAADNYNNSTRHMPSAEDAERSVGEPNEKESLKGLTLLEAIKVYLSMFPGKQSVKEITSGLKSYGFDGEIKYLCE